MKIRYKAFILPHLGDPYRLCADRFSIGEKEKAFAISDGVGNSLFPEVWAKSLCDDYVQLLVTLFVTIAFVVKKS